MNKKEESYKNKKVLYFDVDDVILNSSETAIKIFNSNYNINPPKEFKDIKDWGYKSIDKRINVKDIEEMYKSEEFWNNIKINKNFEKIIENKLINKNYKIEFTTRGSSENLKKKEETLKLFLENKEIEWEFNGINNEKIHEQHGKSHINMSNGIQIDDNINYLNTNAKIKILLTNNIETDYNRFNKKEIMNNTNLYIINDLSELEDILVFFVINDIYELGV